MKWSPGHPYVLDGLTQKVREGGRIVNVCVVGDGGQCRRAVRSWAWTPEDGAFWLAFLRSLTARGLSGVELATSLPGAEERIAAVFAGASWKHRVPSVPNVATNVKQPSTAKRVVELREGGQLADHSAFTAFPVAHWQKLWSNNPQERLNHPSH